jgi:NusA-like KH domain protein
MVNTIDMQDLRYLNLFGKITKVNTRFCLKYNKGLIFCVPKPLISKAIGEGGKNVRQMCGIIKKKIKIISSPNGIEDSKTFIEAIVNPVVFKDLEITDNEIIINAGGTQNKAALIGRNKIRLLKLQKIVKDYFGKEVRIS